MFDLRSNPETNRAFQGHVSDMEGLEDRLLEHGVEFIYGLIRRIIRVPTALPRGWEQRLEESISSHFSLSSNESCPRGPNNITGRCDEGASRRSQALRWPLPDVASHGRFQLHANPARQLLVAKLECGSSSLKIWDSSRSCAYRISDMPRFFEILGAIVRGVGRAIPLPKIPAPGESLRIWSIYDIMTGPDLRHEAQALIARANNLALEHGVDYLIIAVDAGEEELQWIRRSCIMPLKYRVMVKEYSPVPGLQAKRSSTRVRLTSLSALNASGDYM